MTAFNARASCLSSEAPLAILGLELEVAHRRRVAQLSQQTDPVMQVRQFIRSVNEGAHAGNPDSVVDQKVRQGWWSPWSR